MQETKERLKDKLFSVCNNFINVVLDNKFKMVKYTSIVIIMLIVSMFSKILGFIGFATMGILFTKKQVFPLIKKLTSKFLKTLNSHNIFDRISNYLSNVKTKLLSLHTKKEDVKKDQVKDSMPKHKTIIHNKISNLKVAALSKFKSSHSVKKDILGVRIVDGEYELKAKQIIQDNINLNDVRQFIEFSKQKVKVRSID